MYKVLNKIKTKEEFIEFINILIKDNRNKPEEWEGKNIIDYLESIQSWIEDMDGFYENTKQEVPQHINWNFIASLLYVGKIYE